jgi:membrane protein YdbS with pleckstrin-like domain
MKQRTKQVISIIGGMSLAFFLILSATLAMLSGRFNYRNYWGGVVFAPLAIILGIVLMIFIYRHVKGKDRNWKSDEELFEGSLQDWRKW